LLLLCPAYSDESFEALAAKLEALLDRHAVSADEKELKVCIYT